LLAEVGAEDVVGDGKQVGSEASLLLESIATLDAAEKGLLDQVVDVEGAPCW
jgi:hypothetical protein